MAKNIYNESVTIDNETKPLVTWLIDCYKNSRDIGLTNDESIKKILTDYEAYLGDKIKNLDGGVKSVRSKLVREGVYLEDNPVVKTKKNGPTKKELLATLREKTGLEFKGLEPASKEAIKEILDLLEDG